MATSDPKAIDALLDLLELDGGCPMGPRPATVEDRSGAPRHARCNSGRG